MFLFESLPPNYIKIYIFLLVEKILVSESAIRTISFLTSYLHKIILFIFHPVINLVKYNYVKVEKGDFLNIFVGKMKI